MTITITIPSTFQQTLDELVRMSNAPSREAWFTNLVRNVVFDYQIRKDFAPQQEERIKQLNAYWPLP